MTRSARKGPYVDPRLMKKVRAAIESGQKKVIKTWSRSCTITPEFVGQTFGVHNGKEFLPVFCTELMVGHKLGEFSPTRKFRGHGGKLAKITGTDKVAAPTSATKTPAAK